MSYASPTTINASAGIGEVLTYVNTVTNSWISNIFLLVIYVVILMAYYRSKTDFLGGMAVAGYTLVIVGTLFFAAGFVSGITLSITIAVSLIGIAGILLRPTRTQ